MKEMRFILCLLILSLPLLVHSHLMKTDLELGMWARIFPNQIDTCTWFKSLAVIGSGIAASFYLLDKKCFSIIHLLYIFLLGAATVHSQFLYTTIMGDTNNEGLLVLLSYPVLMLVTSSIKNKKPIGLCLGWAAVIQFGLCLLQYFTRDWIHHLPFVFSNPVFSRAVSVSSDNSAGFTSVNHLGLFCALLGTLAIGQKSYAPFLLCVAMCFISHSRLGFFGMGAGITYLAFSKSYKLMWLAVPFFLAFFLKHTKPIIGPAPVLDVNGYSAKVGYEDRYALLNYDPISKRVQVEGGGFTYSTWGPYFLFRAPTYSTIFSVTEKSLAIVVQGELVIPTHAPHVFFKNTSFDSRGFVWSRIIPMIKDHPWLGYGPGVFEYVFPQFDMEGKLRTGFNTGQVVERPHNFYFQQAINAGLPFLAVILIIIWLQFIQSLSLPKKAAIVGFLAAALFTDSTVEVSPYFWIVLGL